MKRVLFEDAYLEDVYKREREARRLAAEAADDPDEEVDCTACNGFGYCSHCHHSCEECDGLGTLRQEVRRRNVEAEALSANTDEYYDGTYPGYRDCAICKQRFKEYVTSPRTLCDACIRDGKAWMALGATGDSAAAGRGEA